VNAFLILGKEVLEMTTITAFRFSAWGIVLIFLVLVWFTRERKKPKL
jgi:hypothetical protein